MLKTIHPVVDVINFFGGILENLDFPLRMGHVNSSKQYQSIFLLKIALFSHFSAGSNIKTNFFQFLNFGKSRFPPIKVL